MCVASHYHIYLRMVTMTHSTEKLTLCITHLVFRLHGLTENAAEWLAHLLIREILFSNLGPETSYPEFFCRFSQSFLANAGIVPQVRPRPFLYPFFPQHIIH
jgi:hypothetical protein